MIVNEAAKDLTMLIQNSIGEILHIEIFYFSFEMVTLSISTLSSPVSSTIGAIPPDSIFKISDGDI